MTALELLSPTPATCLVVTFRQLKMLVMAIDRINSAALARHKAGRASSQIS
jgi:hypothetical protein